MLKADDSLEFILEQVQDLGRGDKAHEKAAYRALIHMTQRWAEPTDLFIDEDLQMAERIGQDLADIARHDLVLPSPSHGLRAMIDRFARSAGISLNVWLEMDALTQIKELVSRGSAFTILAPASVQHRVERGLFPADRLHGLV